MLIAIAAVDENFVIGDSTTGKMPWHNKEELKYFKETTTGNIVLMGRRTAESVGALPNRTNILLTRNHDYKLTNFENVSLKEVLELSEIELVFVCGGAEVYEILLPACDQILLSKLPIQTKGDVYFPKNMLDEFELVRTEQFNSFEVEQWDRK